MIIIGEKLVDAAVRLASHSIEKILDDPRFVWGPKYVHVTVLLPEEHYSYVIGNETEWDPKWPEEPCDIKALAFEKARIARREKNDTSVLRDYAPWLFKQGENSYAGGIYYGNISIGVSGANENTDENIAKIIMTCIFLHAHAKAEELKKSS
ncbi:MAG TPA: hypothetical protein P5052_01760 [Candidatus Paceibacterota bacterium]|jgi:hypothetical protein|nr:hypothetical protein [Candidatus Paceibacterota bacterium]HRZ29487.1 hypothetical protein [Candidatus Paceibacterota bacterium]